MGEGVSVTDVVGADKFFKTLVGRCERKALFGRFKNRRNHNVKTNLKDTRVTDVHRVSVSYDNVLQKHVSRKMRGIS